MSKRLPYPKFEGQTGEKYWRSLREQADSPALLDEIEREFPDGAAVAPDGVSRRDFFKYMGASVALAGVAACRRPDEKILPYSKQPEEVIPGVPLYFATVMPWNGTAVGLVVESHEGRPTKIEGNPLHPESLGSTNTWIQADVLNLYDPDRSTSPAQKGENRSWGDAVAALRALGAKHRKEGGKGLAILTEAHRSPTTARLLARLQGELPGTQVFRYEPWSRDNARAGAELAFGKVVEPIYHLDKAKVVVSLDADLLMNDGASMVRHARGFAASRSQTTPGSMSRLYIAESTFSVTGAMADHRLRLPSGEVSRVAVALARALDMGGLPSIDVPENAAKFVAAVAKDLRANKGRALVVAGEKQPPAVHALAHQMNLALAGAAVTWVEAFDPAPEGARSIAALAKAITDKAVTSLIILGGNPVLDAPADAKLAELLAQVETSVHLSLHADETSAVTSWHVPRAHTLESWGDLRSLDGTLAIVQPLIAPLFGGKTDAEVVSLLLGEPARAYELIRKTQNFADNAWRRALHDGVVEGSTYPAQSPSSAGTDKIAAALKDALSPATGYEVTFVPDSHAWDGRFANNAWTQEGPDPMTKMVWGNAALVSPATAKELGVENGDLLGVQTTGGASAVVPALIAVGQADKSITLSFGQGRKHAGRVGNGVGVDTYPLRTVAAMTIAGAKVGKAGGNDPIVTTQENFNMANRWPVRAATIEEYAKEPEMFRGEKFAEPHPKLLSLYPDYDYSKGHRWAMTIDLNTCIGCGACTIACQAENNIAVVGKSGVSRSREMHWIRVDRYFRGRPDEPESVTQPMTCQQCENAPCEQVCPVGATQHSPEGLNDMAYNRCIGTRYCLNNCPFKVRHFNFFNYTKRSAECIDGELPALRQAQFNPDVTVRSRGVMEKCTYCVQRINEAKIDAHKAGTETIADGTIKTACQQTCPTSAIVFGDLNDPTSAVAKLKNETRSYVMLEELNIRPRTTYLARIANPNPELV